MIIEVGIEVIEVIDVGMTQEVLILYFNKVMAIIKIIDNIIIEIEIAEVDMVVIIEDLIVITEEVDIIDEIMIMMVKDQEIIKIDQEDKEKVEEIIQRPLMK